MTTITYRPVLPIAGALIALCMGFVLAVAAVEYRCTGQWPSLERVTGSLSALYVALGAVVSSIALAQNRSAARSADHANDRQTERQDDIVDHAA